MGGCCYVMVLVRIVWVVIGVNWRVENNDCVFELFLYVGIGFIGEVVYNFYVWFCFGGFVVVDIVV